MAIAAVDSKTKEWAKLWPKIDFTEDITKAHTVISSELEDLKNLKIKYPKAKRLWLTEPNNLSPKNLDISFEDVELFQVIEPKDNFETVERIINLAETEFYKEQERRILLKDLRGKNNQLEEMTDGLQDAILQGTRVVSDSKIQIENKLAKLNELIRFVKELTHCREIEDLLNLVRKEVRPFHRLGSPILACEVPQQGRRLFYFRSVAVLERECKSPWADTDDIRISIQDDSYYLANEMQRPVGPLVSVPLCGGKAVLYFEHSKNSAQCERFVTFLSFRLEALSLTLDRILSDTELKSTSLLWEQTFDGIKDPIAIVSDKFQLLRANRHFSEDVSLKKCHIHFAGNPEPCDGCVLPLALKKQTSSEGRVRRNGSTYDLHTYPIFFENEALTFVNHYVDVTKSIELQSQLVQNEKMVAVGHLAGHIAHELNNPLSGICSFTEILLTSVDGTLAADLREVEKAARRCQKIIENLLEFSKGQNPDVMIVDFNDLVQRTLPLLKTAMGLFLSDIKFSEHPLMVLVPAQLMQQVVFNLVVNACQAMQEGGTITIALYDKGAHAELMVSDTGKGIPLNIQHKVFEPFFTTKPLNGGTGLGLSMCQRVVESSQGKIDFVSDQTGTTFFVRLPKVGMK